MTRYEINSNFADNLEKERVRIGLSQKEMATKLELSLSAYKRIITLTTTKIDLYTIYKLYVLTGKSIYELMGVKNAQLDILRKLTELSNSQISFIDSVVDFEKDFKKHNDDADDYVSVYIPTGNMEDGMIYDSTNVEKVNVSEYKSKFGNIINCGIKITSNHLHPVYNLGDILLISRRPARDGDTGVFINKENGCAYIRKFHQTNPCSLEPLNNYGETFYVDSMDKPGMDNWIKFGVVIAKMR
ncbi:MAG: DNA-binding protein [Lachnospiraceae bacterium]|nr:DNA-binding protein [Lachnospiraceae bacterium]